MTPMVHLLLLPLLFSLASGKDLEEKKGPFENIILDVPEGTPVPYPIYQFQTTNAGVTDFRLSGEGKDDIRISRDGWLYLEKPLDWSKENHYVLKVDAFEGDKQVDEPIFVTINVLDINNNAPYFNQSVYTATVRERSPIDVPFTRVFAFDRDDPQTSNADLVYSLVSQIPNNHNIPMFQINPQTGEISTTAEGFRSLKAREGFHYGQGEERSIDNLKAKFDEYCAAQKVPYEDNPFFTCMEKAEMRRENVDPLEDPDYFLVVRVQDQEGKSDTALSGNTRVHIVVQQNLWFNPGPISIVENLMGAYPRSIAKVQSNDPNAIYSLVQKERGLKFPFEISESGVIYLTEQLDREEKDMYTLVVFAKDNNDKEVDPPMEIHVLVLDVNDNAPVCENEESVFEIQEDEPPGSLVGQLLAQDKDQEGTLNSQLTYKIGSLSPSAASNTFSIDEASGRIQALRLLRRNEQKFYHLTVEVSDTDFSTNCKLVIKVIDVNNQLPLFEKSDYGEHTLAEDTPVGHTVVTVRATDEDDADSGSSFIEFHLSAGNDDDTFSVETDGKGIGHVVIAKPLDFESAKTFHIQIDARNPEPLMKDLEYGTESTATFSLSVTDVDETPEFSLNVLDVTVPENFTKGSVLFTVEAKDPEGKEIGFKLDGDSQGWLEIDAASGEIKTKEKLDREKLETFEVSVIVFEKENPEKYSEQSLHVRLLDVNDNYPKLIEKVAFICTKDLKPVILKAEDGDSAPFSQPFVFSFADHKKSPNWELRQIDETTAELRLKKKPTQDRIFPLSINIKDNAGMGVSQLFEVKVCNCTELGYCYVAPEEGFKPAVGVTIAILACILAFCVIMFIIVLKRSDKKKKANALDKEGERSAMM
ncbi:cadherin-17 [Oryzias latipes]|uniref:Cadherin 17, LI cadherin (liver-intestine) n=1 Tax=Oryzias latipes TaxID=8090 RepID=H2LYD6_ORYLA|nr:cadherin-17 [Oryzias latipes]